MNEVRVMLRKVSFIDLILGGSIALILYFAYREASGAFSIGLAAAFINFLISGIITNRVLSNNVSTGTFLKTVRFFKVFLICAVPFFVYRYDIYAITAYIFGFNSHFISLILYSIFNRNPR